MTPNPSDRHRDGYVSEITAFMDDYLGRHPEVRAAQDRHWRQSWQAEVDLDELARARTDTLPQPAYVYFDRPGPRRRPAAACGSGAPRSPSEAAAANDERGGPARRAA